MAGRSYAPVETVPSAPVLRALGPPGVARVFVHSLSRDLLEGIAHMGRGYRGYVARALLLAAPGDVVCVLDPPEPEYLRFLNGLGLGPEPGGVVAVLDPRLGGVVRDPWLGGAVRPGETEPPVSLSRALRESGAALDAVVARLAASDEIALSTFASRDEDAVLARALGERAGRQVRLLAGPPALVDALNRKERGRALALELGIPIAEGEVVELALRHDGKPAGMGALRRAAERLLGRTGRVLIRGSTGASGSATWIVEKGGGLRDTLERIAREARDSVFLVDEMLDVTGSPNVMLHVDPEAGARCVGVTDQRLDAQLRHLGNVAPSLVSTLPEMLRSALSIGERVARDGYAGFAGIDFVEHAEHGTGARRHAFAELNARVNAALYPLCVAERLRARAAASGLPAPAAFVSGGVATHARSFAELAERHGRLFFDASAGRGVVPYPLVHPLPAGKLGLTAFGASGDDALEVYEGFERDVEATSAHSDPEAEPDRELS